jgi:hypothetical protein
LVIAERLDISAGEIIGSPAIEAAAGLGSYIGLYQRQSSAGFLSICGNTRMVFGQHRRRH